MGKVCPRWIKRLGEQKMKQSMLVTIVLCACLSLAACNMPASSGPGSSAISTSAAQTVEAVLSPAATQGGLATAPVSMAATPKAFNDTSQYTAWTRRGLNYDAKGTKKSLAPGKVFTNSWTVK